MSRTARVAVVVCAAIFMSSASTCSSSTSPSRELARDFGGATPRRLSWVLNAYAIVFAALLVPAGRLADLIGRKRVFIGGLLMFTAASALCAAARLGRRADRRAGVQAVGAALLLPTSLALLLPEFPPGKRGAAVGIWAAVGGAAAAPARRSAACSWRRAGAGSSSSTCRSGSSPRSSRVRVLREDARAGRTRRARRRRRGRPRRRRSRRSRSRSSRGSAGAGGPRPSSARFAAAVAARRGVRLPLAPATPRRSSSCAMLRVRPVAAANVGALAVLRRLRREHPRQRPVPHRRCGAGRRSTPASRSPSARRSRRPPLRRPAGSPTATASAPIGLPGALLLRRRLRLVDRGAPGHPAVGDAPAARLAARGVGIGMILADARQRLGRDAAARALRNRHRRLRHVAPDRHGRRRRADGRAARRRRRRRARRGAFVPVWGLCGGLALATAVAFAAMGRVRARGAAEEATPRTVAISAGSA